MIEYHQQRIARNEEDIQAMERGTYRHYNVGPDERLYQDATARMIIVARRSNQVHERCLALAEGRSSAA